MNFEIRQNGLTRSCHGLADAYDFLPPSGYPHHNWRCVSMGGNLFNTGDTLILDVLDARTCRVIGRNGMSRSFEVEMTVGKPTFAGAEDFHHWMVGTWKNSRIYAYRWTGQFGPGILLQRFVIGGSHARWEPTTAQVVYYDRLVIARTGPMDLPPPSGVAGSQDDEGGGYIP